VFIAEIGDVFDLVLKHVKDAPPLQVADHADEFHDFVSKNNRELQPPFYSAYPDLRVSDILRMARNVTESESASAKAKDAVKP
jgi:hypothetical protein